MAIMGGLVVATAPTLVVVPALYASSLHVRRNGGTPTALPRPALPHPAPTP